MTSKFLLFKQTINLPVKFALCLVILLLPAGVFAQLSGTYTINKSISASSTNFVSFKKAAEALKNNGVSGQVTFQVVDTGGAYEEFVNFGFISGSSSSNKILFTNHSINKDKATLSDRAGNWGYMIRFDSSSHIEFRGIRLDARNRGIQGVDFYRKNSYITFKDCEFLGKYVNNYLNIAVLARTTYTKNLDKQHHFYFENCLISEYRKGMDFQSYFWASGYNADHDHVVSKCTFRNVSEPIRTEITEAIEISNNYIEATDKSGKRYFNGMFLQGMISGQVFGNRIVLTAKGTLLGLGTAYCGGQSSQPSRIYNNFVYVNNSDTTAGCVAYQDNSTIRTLVVFNTFRHVAASPKEHAVSFNIDLQQNECNFSNNIISAEGEGLLLDMDTAKKNYLFFNQDRNNWFHHKLDSAFYFRGQLHDLKGFTQAAGKDSNAVSVYGYFDSSGYHTTHYALNGKGTYISAVSKDIDGQNRSSSPDIGCDEFTPPRYAAGIDSLYHPTICAGTNTLNVYLKNLGTDTLNSVRIQWDYRTSSGAWKSHLTLNKSITVAPFEQSLLALDTFSASFNKTYQFRIRVTRVNGVPDTLSWYGLNPFISNEMSPGLGGQYTVGLASSDFPSLRTAIKQLETRGVCGPVELLLEDTSFRGPFRIGKIPFASNRDSILLRSRITSRPARIIRVGFRDTNYMGFLLRDASFIHFRSLQFDSDSSIVNGRYILLEGNCGNISVSNCSFSYQSPFWQEFGIGSTTSSRLTDIRISSCNFYKTDSTDFGGPRNIIYFPQNSSKLKHRNLLIEGNKMDPFGRTGIFIQNANYVQIIGNEMVEEEWDPDEKRDAPCVDLWDITGLYVAKNRWQRRTAQVASFRSCKGTGNMGDIVNNEIVALPFTSYSPMALSFSGSDMRFLYNTLVVYGQNRNSFAFATSIDSNVVLVGNNIANFAGGYAAQLYRHTMLRCQKNNFYSDGPRRLYIINKGQYTTFTDEMEYPDSQNVYLDPYFFQYEKQITFNQQLLNAGSDSLAPGFDRSGAKRDNSPDIGCYERSYLLNDASLPGTINETICKGSQTLTLKLRNDGLDTIRSIKLRFSVRRNDSAFQLISVLSDTLRLAPGESLYRTLGSYTFADGIKYGLKYEIIEVNGVADSGKLGNMLLVDSIWTAIQGEFSVGKPGDDFPSLYDGLNELHRRGMCGPVRFLLRDTTYRYPIYINHIPGSSAQNTFELTSHPANTALPRLDFPSKLNYLWGGQPYEMMVLNNASYVTIDSLVIRSGDEDTLSNSGYRATNLIELKGINRHITFSNDSLIDIPVPVWPSSSQAQRIHIAMETDYNNSYDHIEIHNCAFLNGGSPIIFSGYPGYLAPGTMRIESCSFFGQVQYIFVQAVDSLFFRFNRLGNVKPVYDRYPSGFGSSCGFGLIEGNEFHLRSADGSSSWVSRYGMRFYDSESMRVKDPIHLVYNNMISITGDSSRSTDRALILSGKKAHVYNNSLHLATAGLYKAPLCLSASYTDTLELHMLNNNFTSSRGVAPFYAETPYFKIIKSDHNNYYSKNPYMMRGQITLRTYNEFLTRYGQDANSLYSDPQYLNDSNLHSKSRLLNHGALSLPEITRDIDGDLRDTLRAPDIGADEFQLPLNDARIVAARYLGLCPDTQSVYVHLLNDGDDSIRSVTVSLYTQRGSAWQKLNTTTWRGAVEIKDSFWMSPGQVYMQNDSLIRLRFTIDSVNGKADTVSHDNSFTTDSFTTALPSVVEVGASRRYRTPEELIDALHFRGVCGPTRIEIDSGTYRTFKSIEAFPGMGAGAPVQFIGKTSGAYYPKLVTNWDSTGSDYLLRLHGVQHLHFDSLFFEGDGTINQALFKLEGNTQFIHFENDSFVSRVPKNSYQRGLIFDDFDQEDSSKYLFIRNNYFEGPNVGVMLVNWNSKTGVDSVYIQNNHFERLRNAVYTAAISGLVVENNTIHVVNPAHSQSVGFWGDLCHGSIYNNNRIEMSGSDQLIGFWLEYRNDNSRFEPVFVTNNTVSIRDQGSQLNSIAYYMNYLRNLTAAHNSAYVESNDTGSYGTCIFQADRWPGTYRYFNNSNEGAGNARAFLLWYDTSSTWISDYNNHWSKRAKAIRYGYKLGGLNTLQQLSAQDSHSLQVDPAYYEWNDLHTNSGALAAAGKAMYNLVQTDMDGDRRDSLKPCIGADEYPYRAHQAEIIRTYPPSFCPGVSAIYADIRNIGDDTIRHVHIRYTLETIESGRMVNRDTFVVAGILSGDSLRFALGQIEMAGDSSYRLHLEIDSINRSSLFLKRFNRWTSDTMRTSLSGTFTIGASNSDYRSFNAAVRDLEKRGICSHIRYLVREGTYNEQFIIPSIIGQNIDRTVEFVSHPSNKKPPKVVFAPGSASDNYLVRFDNTSWITLDSINFENTSGTLGRIIHFTGKNDQIKITNDSFITGKFSTSAQFAVIEQQDVAWTGQYLNNLTLTDCYIHGGSKHLELGTGRTGNPKSRVARIQRNKFYNFGWYGVRLQSMDSLTFSHNHIQSIDSGAESRGAMWYQQGKIAAIHDNQIEILARIPSGLYLSVDSGTATSPLRVYNNRIIVRNWASGVQNDHTGCIALDRGTYIDIDHNNIKADAGKQWLYGLYLVSYYGNATDNLNIRNNVLSGYQYAQCLFTTYGVGNIKSDHNCWYSENSIIASWGKKTHTNLSSIQSLGTDSNSVYGNPNFKSYYDLHTNAKHLNGAGTPLSAYPRDMDGEQRNSSAPDIGSDEMNSSIHDLAVTGLQNGNFDLCNLSAVDLPVIVKNNGNFDEPDFTIQVLVSGPISDTIRLRVQDTLEYGTSDTFHLRNLNLSAVGKYLFTVSVSVAKDSFTYNDTLTRNWQTHQLRTPVVQDYKGCFNESYFIFLKAPGGYSGYRWYEDSSSTKVIGTDSTLQLVGKRKTDSYYLEIDAPNRVGLGPASYNFGSNTGANDYSLGLRFDVNKHVLLDSLSIYPGNAGELVLNIYDSAGRVVYKRSYNIVQSGLNKIPLDVFLPKGVNYRIDLQGTTINSVRRNTAGANYPYRDAYNIMRIKSDENGALNAYNYFYDWKIREAVCMTGRMKVQVTVEPNPSDPKVQSDSVCSGQTALFVAQGGSGNSYSWYRKEYDTKSFWQGDSLNVVDLTTAYSVFIQNDSNNGCTSRRIQATVHPIPLPRIPSARDTIACSEDSLEMHYDRDTLYYWFETATDVDEIHRGSSFKWDVADFDSIWIASSSRGCLSKRDLIQIDKRQQPKLPEVFGDSEICEGEDLELTTGGVVVSWTDTAENVLLTDSVFILSNPAHGTYRFRIVADSGGCSARGTLPVTVLKKPGAFTFETDTVCPEHDAEIRITSPSAVRWFKSDTSVQILSTQKSYTDTNGTGHVFYMQLDSLGCLSARFPAQATVRPDLIPVLSGIRGDTVCFGVTAIALAESANSRVRWYRSSDFSEVLSDSNRLTISEPGESGYYYVRGTNAYCSDDGDSVHLLVHALPDAGFSQNQLDNNFTLTADSIRSKRTYTWTLPDGSSKGPEAEWTAEANGEYPVMLEVFDSISGCTNLSSDTLVMTGLGVYSGSLKDRIFVYPIPNKGSYTIEHAGLAGIFEVFDGTGRLIRSGTLHESGRTQVNQDMSTGIYMLSVRSDRGVFQIKMLIK